MSAIRERMFQSLSLITWLLSFQQSFTVNTCSRHESFDKHLWNEKDSSSDRSNSLMLVSSSVSWLHSETKEATCSCSSRSSNDLFIASSASSMLLFVRNIESENMKKPNWIFHQTWSRWFCSISFCHATQPHPLVFVFSMTFDEESFWNSFCCQQSWKKCLMIGQHWQGLCWLDWCNWILSAMKCFDAMAFSSLMWDLVEVSLVDDFEVLAIDWSRCRYHNIHQSAVLNLTINVIRNYSTFFWMESRKLNSTVDIKVELNCCQDVPSWFKMFSQFIVYLWTRCRHDLCFGYHREWIIFEMGEEVNEKLRNDGGWSESLPSSPHDSIQFNSVQFCDSS